jgi:hypothetical protein
MRPRFRFGLALSAGFVVGLLSGCGGKPLVKVHGKVTMKGEPLQAGQRKSGSAPAMMMGNGELVKVEQMESLSVVFYPLTPAGETDKKAEFYWAGVDPDGSYKVLGKEGGGLPPGKYRISVSLPTAFTNVDELRGAFGPDNSKIIRDIPGEPREQEINIDLGNP